MEVLAQYTVTAVLLFAVLLCRRQFGNDRRPFLEKIAAFDRRETADPQRDSFPGKMRSTRFPEELAMKKKSLNFRVQSRAVELKMMWLWMCARSEGL